MDLSSFEGLTFSLLHGHYGPRVKDKPNLHGVEAKRVSLIDSFHFLQRAVVRRAFIWVR